MWLASYLCAAVADVCHPQMFGEAPPQKLYHTRQAVSSPGSSASPATGKPWQAPRSPTHTPKSPSGSGPRNLNQTSYKGKSKKGRRPGTADSDRPLLSPSNEDDQRLSAPLSDVYLHYRQSLNSLNHIIDQVSCLSLRLLPWAWLTLGIGRQAVPGRAARLPEWRPQRGARQVALLRRWLRRDVPDLHEGRAPAVAALAHVHGLRAIRMEPHALASVGGVDVPGSPTAGCEVDTVLRCQLPRPHD